LRLNPKSQVGGYVAHILRRGKDTTAGSTYVGPLYLPVSQGDCQPVLDALYELRSESRLFKDNEIAYKYVIAELIDNIYEHSGFQLASVMAQRYGRKGFVELCFFDDGITIPGNFERSGKKYRKEVHSNAIYEAMRGVSTKPDVGRGYGLSSNVELFRDVGGEWLIVSGYGAIYLVRAQVIPYRLSSTNMLRGTLISLRVEDRTKSLNVFEHLEATSVRKEAMNE
jgi:hypothetical protein